MNTHTLLKRFSDRPWIFRAKLWTPKYRNTIETSGGLSKGAGDLVNMLLCVRLTPEQEERVAALAAELGAKS